MDKADVEAPREENFGWDKDYWNFYVSNRKNRKYIYIYKIFDFEIVEIFLGLKKTHLPIFLSSLHLYLI